MENKVFLKDMLNEMRLLDSFGKRIPFDIEFRTFNSQNKSGGNYRIYKYCKFLIKEGKNKTDFNPESHFYRKFKKRVNPNHWDNFTINVELQNGQIIKIKTKYIIKFNNKYVVY